MVFPAPNWAAVRRIGVPEPGRGNPQPPEQLPERSTRPVARCQRASLLN